MAPRFSRPRLIAADDKQYRAFLAQIMLSKDNQRAIRPPRPRDLFGSEAEAALREWLGTRSPLSERRIVEYLEHRGRSAVRKYRELDALVLRDSKTIHVFEIKASQSAASLRRASLQLRDTRAILGMLYARVHATILLVDTGIPTSADVTAMMAGPDAPPAPPPTLDEVLATLPQIRPIASLDAQPDDPSAIGLLRFTVDDIVALAGAENLHLDWEDEEEEPADVADEPEPAEERYAYSTDTESDEDDDNPLAAALRRAMSGSDGEARRQGGKEKR